MNQVQLRGDKAARAAAKLCRRWRSQGKQVEVDVKRADLRELQAKDFQVPPETQGDLVVGQPERVLLNLGKASKFNGIRTGLCEPEILNGSNDLLDLSFRVNSRIATIRFKRAGRSIVIVSLRAAYHASAEHWLDAEHSKYWSTGHGATQVLL